MGCRGRGCRVEVYIIDFWGEKVEEVCGEECWGVWRCVEGRGKVGSVWGRVGEGV